MKIIDEVLYKSGIYSITNNINKKRYIGCTIRFSKRFNSHKHNLKNNKHHCRHLQNAWNKHGQENFKFEIVEIVQDIALLVEKEQYWADFYKSFDEKYGYNSGECLEVWNRGIKYPKELKDKLSRIQKSLMTPERLYMLRTNNLGRKFGPEFREKCKKNFLGKHHTKESKKKISESQRQTQLTRTVQETRAIFAHEMICIFLVSPNSEVYEIYGVREFCREYKLDRAAIMRVVNGKNRTHKGWTQFNKDTSFLNKITKDYRK